MRFTGDSFAVFRTDGLTVNLRRLAFFVRGASQAYTSRMVGSKGPFHLVYVRRGIIEELANHLSVSGEV